MHKVSVFGAVGACLAVASAAHAATVVEKFTLTTTGPFTDTLTGRMVANPPQAMETLSFTLTFDPDVSFGLGDQPAISDFMTNVPTDGKPLSVQYYVGQLLTLSGGTYSGSPSTLSGDYTNFALHFTVGASGDITPGNALLQYDNYRTLDVAVTATSAAPEPAAWALVIVGIGGIGAALRRRASRVTVSG